MSPFNGNLGIWGENMGHEREISGDRHFDFSVQIAEWYKGRMVLGGSGKVSFGRRIREDPLSPYSG